MAGIYLHVPFCKTKCHYCDFFSLATTRFRDEFTEALRREIRIRKDYLNGVPIETIYFGGGTPSLLSAEIIKLILEDIQDNFSIAAEPEITLEANPDDLGPDKLEALKSAGINRLSIGVQSFRNIDLQSLNRVHDEKQALQCLIDAKSAGFNNISIDLIYGIPGLEMKAWQENLEVFASLDIQHLSSYWLTIEAGTALAGFIRKGKYPSPDEASGAAQYEYLMEWARNNEFLHYEVSNYAREGHFSKHNTAYWQAKPYLGLGPSAHSYNGSARQWNISNLAGYIKGMMEGKPETGEELIGETQKYNEYIMTSMRTIWGCDLGRIARMFGSKRAENTHKQAQKYIDMGWLKEDQDVLYVINEGWLHVDGISADLFLA